jgi:Pentapeptide repeats (9 copies)
MDTNSNIPGQKKAATVEILYLNDLGYGPGGALTRKEWRELCLEKLYAGNKIFNAWQKSWYETEQGDEKIRFHYQVSNSDASAVTPFSLLMHRCSYDFIGCNFGSALHINGYLFLKTADFSYSAFGLAFFKATSFAQVSFEYAVFEGHTNFGLSHFRNKVTFRRALFNGDAHFEGALFKGDAYFIQAEFKKHCQFCNQLDKEKKSWGQETRFLKEVDFENAIFKSVCHFERVHFLGSVPSFLGVENALTRVEFSGDRYFQIEDFSEDAVKRLGQLKRLSDEHGQTDQALMFNALELNAKAKQYDASNLFKMLTWLYDKVSDYGRSFGRPFLTYIGLIFITYLLALFAAANNSPQDCKGELWRVFSDMRDNGSPSCLSAELPDDKLKLNGYRAAFEYTTYRAAGILDFSDNDKQTVAVSKRLFNADVEPTWMRFWGIFKAIASAALLFLAALGLRNKYRIK